MRFLVFVVSAVLLVGCSSSDGEEAGPVTTAAVLVTTPRPSAAEAASLGAEIRAIYPEVPTLGGNDKAVDWAVSTCSDILDGIEGAELEGRVIHRFSGGDRAAPTPEQARRILEVIQANGFCER